MFIGFARDGTRTANEEAVMMDIHPNYLKKDGRPEFVVLSVEEFESLRESSAGGCACADYRAP